MFLFCSVCPVGNLRLTGNTFRSAVIAETSSSTLSTRDFRAAEPARLQD